MSETKLFVGQILHEPPTRRHTRWNEYVVEKIGRKWAVLSHGARCTLDTLYLDCGGYSPRQLYVSRDAYEDEQALNTAWLSLRRDIENSRHPRGLTLETIAQVRVMLELKAAP